MSSSSAKRRRVSGARSGEASLLMRAECSANRVALVRTRSINEIKTDPSRAAFLSFDCVITVGRSIGRAVRAIDQSSARGSVRSSTTCQSVMSHHYLIFHVSAVAGERAFIVRFVRERLLGSDRRH